MPNDGRSCVVRGWQLNGGRTCVVRGWQLNDGRTCVVRGWRLKRIPGAGSREPNGVGDQAAVDLGSLDQACARDQTPRSLMMIRGREGKGARRRTFDTRNGKVQDV